MKCVWRERMSVCVKDERVRECMSMCGMSHNEMSW